MRALLVNPEFPDTYWGFNHALRFEGKKSAFPPLGLLTVSSMMPHAWQRRLLDLNAGDMLFREDIEWADMILVTGMLIQKKAVHRIVSQCKALRKRVLVGGPYVATTMEAVPEADHIFVGEVEETFPEFVRDLASGHTRRVYKAADRPLLQLTPLPDFGLLNFRLYHSMSVQFSRGCPFDCEFCDIIEIYGRVPRTKSSSQILAELETLYLLGWRGSLFFVDDNFIGNKKSVKHLMPELMEWQKGRNYPFRIFTEASVNLADDQMLLSDMHESGFTKVFLGIETPVEAALKETQKLQNTKRGLVESVHRIQAAGLEVMAGFIVGFDSDPEDVFDLQIEFIRTSGIPLAMVGKLDALPDTQLWRRLEKEGRLIAESGGNNIGGESPMNFVPVMDARSIVAGHKTIMRTIYQSREFYARVHDSFARFQKRRVAGESEASFMHKLRTFARVVICLGVMDENRREFWRFFFATLRQYPGRFSQAVSLAAMGYHFRKISS